MLNDNLFKMKTILKFLNVFILIFIISLIVDAFGKLYSIIHYLLDNSDKIKIDETIFPTQWSNLSIILYIVIGSILLLFLAYLALIFRRVIKSFSRNSYFSGKNVTQLFNVGKGLIIYGLGVFILTLILNFFSIEFSPYNFGRVIGMSLAKSIPVFIFSSFALLIASIIKKGNVLKNENDLTI